MQKSEQKLDVYQKSLSTLMGLRNMARLTFSFNQLCVVLLLKSMSISLSHRTERPTNRSFNE